MGAAAISAERSTEVTTVVAIAKPIAMIEVGEGSRVGMSARLPVLAPLGCACASWPEVNLW